MENFKKEVRKKVLLYQSISGITGLCIVLLALFNRSSSTNTGDFNQGAQIGIFVGLALVTLYYIGKLKATLKNEGKLKKMYIEETDERRRLIEQKTGQTTSIIVIFSIPIAIVVAGFYSFVVVLTLLVTLIFLLIITVSVKLYYNHKF